MSSMCVIEFFKDFVCRWAPFLSSLLLAFAWGLIDAQFAPASAANSQPDLNVPFMGMAEQPVAADSGVHPFLNRQFTDSRAQLRLAENKQNRRLPPILPVLPSESESLSSKEFDAFIKSIEQQWRATDVMVLIDRMLDQNCLTQQQRETLKEMRQVWQERADANLQRLGKAWIDRSEVKAAEEESENLIRQAEAIIATNHFEGSHDLLRQASKVYENGIRADYTLGLIYTRLDPRTYNLDLAEKHFRTVLSRFPDHPAALNSLAITHVKQGELASAYREFERSALVSRMCPEVTHNVGRVLFLAEDRRLKLDHSTSKKFTKLYATLVVNERGKEFQKNIGWKHMWPVFSSEEREEKSEEPVNLPVDNQFVPRGFGSAFVVDNEYVISNRHVVYDEGGQLGMADKVTYVERLDGNSFRELPANIVAISETSDLVLLNVPGLKSKPLHLRTEPFQLATEVVIMGMPQPQELGVGLKVTQGIVAGLIDQRRRIAGDYYLFDATSGPGNSGGPVCDHKGFVGAVLTITIRSDSIQLTGGVPAEDVAAFFEKTLHRPVSQNSAQEAEKTLAEMVQSKGPSVSQVRTYDRAGVNAIAHLQQSPDDSNYYEDKACSMCRGRSWLSCPKPGCIKGNLTEKGVARGTVRGGGLQMPIQLQTRRLVDCPLCVGGRINCPGCIDGMDRFLGK